ncbi:unnamed protein product [Gongylonema pulchrum]|uniref:Sulfotransfer_1 domain-containing protein n=1 Tax=Gongylonema pulchrum TaxID=637853 RepID=A0A183DP61_9BILA|nr:unnamed protein product [Gongylonema pulchrum]
MAPTSNRNRELRIKDAELPSTAAQHQPNSASCSTEAHQAAALIFQREGHPKQAYIDGEIWPPIFKPEFVRSAKALVPRDSDVFVCTYPKCGTTWIQHICSQLMTDNYGPQVGHGKELCVTSPMIERMGAKFADNLACPRLLKTHFAWNNIPKSSSAKYIFAVRNPKDCLTSYFFHNRNFKIYDYENGDFSAFFELFLSEKIAFGNYFEHLLSWLPHIHDANVLFLRYEDMCADLRQAVRQIGEFLGGEAAKRIQNETILSRIVENSTIGSMKKDQWRWFPENNLHQNSFIRKGGSGDWRNHFTREQSDRLDAEFRKHLGGTVAANWWKEELTWDEVEDSGIEADLLSSSPFSTEKASSSASSSRRSSLENCRRDSIELVDFSNLKASLQNCIPLRERFSSQSSSGYSSLSSSLY